jgi:hypothetical protein
MIEIGVEDIEDVELPACDDTIKSDKVAFYTLSAII